MRAALIVLTLFAITQFANAAGNRIDCFDVVKGDGVTVETKLTFDSKVPALNHSIKLEFKGNPPLSTETVFLSTSNVCGLSLDFTKQCKAIEKFDPKFGYAYTFSCGNDVKRAELYCDEGCMTSAGSGATFRCEGPKVDKKLSGGGLPFSGCKFTKAN